MRVSKTYVCWLTRHAYAVTAKQWHVCDNREFRKLMFLGLTQHAYTVTAKQWHVCDDTHTSNGEQEPLQQSQCKKRRPGWYT